MSKISQCAYKGCVNVSGWLRLLIVGSLILKPVILVRPTHNCTNQDVWVGGLGFHEVEA